MPDLTIWFSRADFIEMGEFLAPEGRRLFEIKEFLAEEGSNFFETHPSYIINSSRIFCCYQLTAKITLLIRRAIFAVL